MKTLHQFWQNQFFRIVFICCLHFLSEGSLYSQEPVPGVLDSLEKIINGHRNQYTKYKKNVVSNPKLLEDMSQVEDIFIDSLYLRSIVLHSEFGFINLAKKDRCTFFALIENNLLKNTEGPLKNIVVNIKFKDKEKLETYYINKNKLLSFIHKDKCFTNKEILGLFQPINIKKTLDTLEYPVPNNSKECENILKDWKTNKYTPYLCGVSKIITDGTKAELGIKNLDDTMLRQKRVYGEQIKRKKKYTEKLDFFIVNYLNNLCQGIDDTKKFCKKYLSSDVWSKIVNGEEPQYKMSYKCQNLLRKKDVNVQDLLNCAKKFKEKPSICRTLTSRGFPSLYPKPDCDHISDALNYSNLVTKYHDCPGRVDNSGIINIHRIIQHYSGKVIPANSDKCLYIANSSFANLNFDYKYSKGWPLRICYKNRVTKEDECKVYIPGFDKEDKLSENNVVEQVLQYLIGMSDKQQCRIVSDKKFNPILLDYKNGCFIVFDQDNCTATNCPKKVYYNEKEVSGIQYVGKTVFSYFPNSMGNPSFALSSIIDDVYKIQTRTVQNFTELKFFLDNPNYIIHGIGCVEDLLPTFFEKRSMNQCQPVPFIIDGYMQDQNRLKVAIRTALDDIHSPRMINWSRVYNAIKSYQSIHPLKSWTMNVLR